MFPLSAAHGANVSQDVGGVLGAVLTDGGCLHIHAGHIQLQHGRQGIRVHVGQKYIVAQTVHTEAQAQLIAQAQHRPGIQVAPVLRDTVAGTQPVHQQCGGNIRVKIVPVGQKALEIILPGSVVIAEGVFVGPILGDGQVVGILDPLLTAQLHQLQQGFVGRGGTGQNIVVHHQVITGPVGHQYIAVGVQNVAPGRLDTGQRGKSRNIIGTAAGGNDLHIVELAAKGAHDQAKDQQQNTHPFLGYSFHVSPPILPMYRRTGYSAGTGSRVSMVLITKAP